MKQIIIMACCIFFVALWTGCGTNQNHTYRGELLDDKVTLQRVEAALSQGGPDFKNVQVDVTNGVVTLNGKVATAQRRIRAENMARSVRREAKLEDELQVRE